MNNAAPRFSRMIQDELIDAIVLRIARLTDPPKSTGKPNLTIQQLPLRIQDPQFSKKVSDVVNVAIASAEFCRNRRHTTLAHNSLDLALRVNKQALPPLTRDNISKAIDALAKVLNTVSSRYLKSTTMFDVVNNSGGARSLLKILEYGISKKRQRMEALKRGESPRDEGL